MMIFEYFKRAALLGSFVYSFSHRVRRRHLHRDRQADSGNLWKELIEERNQAIATVVAAMILGIGDHRRSAMH